jgi:hypothetical protein
MAHEHLHRLATAASENDRIAAEGGLEPALDALGLSIEDVRYVAEQRALRAVLAHTGRAGEIPREPEMIRLGVSDKLMLQVFTPLYIDGIAIGWRARGTLNA